MDKKKIAVPILATVAIAVAASLLIKPETLTLKGAVQNTVIPSISTVSGKIVKLDKGQGDTVKKGEPIALIDPTNLQFTVDQMSALVRLKTAVLAGLTSGTRPEQIAQSEAQVRGAKAQLDLLTSGNRAELVRQAENAYKIAQEALSTAQIASDYAQKQYQRSAELGSASAASPYDVETAKLRADTAARQLETARFQCESAYQQWQLLKSGSTDEAIRAARANFEAAEAQLTLLRNGATKEAVDAARADVDQATAQLNLARNQLKNCTVSALADGIIISLNYELGDVVNPGNNIADIADDHDVYVLCYIPDSDLARIAYGQQLSVKTSLGTQTGTVSYIALKHEYTPLDLQTVSDTKHKATKFRIRVDSQNGRLKAGMEATVSVPKPKKE